MKICSKCKIEKELIEFNKSKTGKYGIHSRCKLCIKQYNKQHYLNNQDKLKSKHKQHYVDNQSSYKQRSKQWNQDNLTKVKQYNKQYNIDNQEKLKQQHKQYYINHKEEKIQYDKQYKAKYRKEISQYNSQYCKQYYKNHKKERAQYQVNKRKTDIKYKVAYYLRRRLWCARKTNQKTGSAVRDLGCTIEFLKQYIESKFQEGMNWDNYGKFGWHIDHIIPLSFFDLTDRKQFLKACHYTNLQPLWAKDNLSKGNKV
jgi:DNA polymerase II small subunit/DNA polymerase delta subunit B